MKDHDFSESPEFAALRKLSAKVGANPLLVQGAGGNTSIKENGLLWIKASGRWLAHSERDEIFVPVEISPLLGALASDHADAEKAEKFVLQALNPSDLRPSIETTVHALMPQKIVVHVHCVETIALAVQANAEAIIVDRLRGLAYAFIPYRRPGLPLAKAIAERLKPDTNILILGNHGLAVAADTVAEAEELLSQVSQLLKVVPRKAPSADVGALVRLALGSDYRLPADERAHSVATDLVSCKMAAAGSLYPDHVVFLGVGSFIAGPNDSASSIADAARSDGQLLPVSILFPGKGILMRNDANAGADAMALCLADVTSRIAETATLRYLNDSEHGELLNWDAEKYRQELNRRNGATLQ